MRQTIIFTSLIILLLIVSVWGMVAVIEHGTDPCFTYDVEGVDGE